MTLSIEKAYTVSPHEAVIESLAQTPPAVVETSEIKSYAEGTLPPELYLVEGPDPIQLAQLLCADGGSNTLAGNFPLGGGINSANGYLSEDYLFPFWGSFLSRLKNNGGCINNTNLPAIRQAFFIDFVTSQSSARVSYPIETRSPLYPYIVEKYPQVQNSVVYIGGDKNGVDLTIGSQTYDPNTGSSQSILFNWEDIIRF